jgi:bile acid:Na+ symporter, BASS family
MMSMIKIFATLSNLLFVLAILLGLFLPQAAPVASVLILPALMIILTVTLFRFPKGFFRDPRSLLSGALLGDLMNYLVLGNLIILGSIFLIRDEKFWIGLVLIAAVPPAVAILPLGEKLRADKMLTLAGFAGTYLGALILIPLIGVAFLKFIPVHYEKLFIMVVTLVVLPLLLSRIAVDRNWDTRIERQEGTISDGCFFVVFYALAANNANLILRWPIEIILISILAFTIIFLISLALGLIGRFYKIPHSTISSLLLLGTIKNYGLAGGIALYIFNSEAAVPALIFSVFMFMNTIWLKFRARSSGSPKESEQTPAN